jgi:type IV secretory pathway VirD2 relaxase
VIKTRYVGTTPRELKLAKQFLAYLERDGVERDGSPGHLYGANEKFSAEEFRGRLANEKRQFRFIVSPEDGANVDLQEFARELMRQVLGDDRGRTKVRYSHLSPDVRKDAVRLLDADPPDNRLTTASFSTVSK